MESKEKDDEDGDTQKAPTMKPKAKKAINKALSELGQEYWDEFPAEAIKKAFEKQKLEVEPIHVPPAKATHPEASKRYAAKIFMGGEEVGNAVLAVTLYTMPSGRYELTAYVS